MKLYHGTHQETKPFTMYFTADINVAKEFALGLDIDGDRNKESYIYQTEIEESSNISIEDDFLTFDALAYDEHELAKYGDIIFNPETGWYLIKNPSITLIEHYENE